MITTEEYTNVNEAQIKEYHRKKLLELSLKTIGEIPQLEDPNEEQLSWSKNRMKRRWDK
jgi:hypothetical protein